MKRKRTKDDLIDELWELREKENESFHDPKRQRELEEQIGDILIELKSRFSMDEIRRTPGWTKR